MSSALHDYSDVVHSRKVNTSLYVLRHCRVDHKIWELLKIAVAFDGRETGIILLIWLHNADGILRVEVGDIILGSDVCARSVVEEGEGCITDGCWGQRG